MTDAFIDLSTKTPQDTPFTVHGRSITDPCKCEPYNGGLPIYDFNGNVPGTKPDDGKDEFPIVKDISFVRGDQWEGEYLFVGKVWTPSRPIDEDGLLLYAEGEIYPELQGDISPIVLPSPWERTHWFSQIRATYGAAIRYYNGWIPWYGSNPGNWWFRHSKVAELVCIAEYSDIHGGTIVKLICPSNSTYRIYPSQTAYRWSCIRSQPSVVDATSLPEPPDDEPIQTTGWANIHTMLAGKVVVDPSWTAVPIDFPDQNLHLGNEPHLNENIWIRPPTPNPNWLPPATPEFAPQKPVEAKPPEVTP